MKPEESAEKTNSDSYDVLEAGAPLKRQPSNFVRSEKLSDVLNSGLGNLNKHS